MKVTVIGFGQAVVGLPMSLPESIELQSTKGELKSVPVFMPSIRIRQI